MRQIQAALELMMVPQQENTDEKRRIVHVNMNETHSSHASKKTAKTVGSQRDPLDLKPKTPEKVEPTVA